LHNPGILVERAFQQLDLLIRRGFHGLPPHPVVIRMQPAWSDGVSLLHADVAFKSPLPLSSTFMVESTVSPGQQPSKRPSLEDVASVAGVGKSTAARALKGDKHVARKTQKVVMDAAQKLGYQPDPVLSTLARERWRGREGYSGVSVALIHHGRPGENERTAAELEGILSVAGPRGYKIDVIDTAEYPHAARLEEVLVTRNYRGLIVGPLDLDPDWLQLDWELFSIVTYGAGRCQPAADLVTLDYFGLSQLAFRQLVAAGYQRIGLCLLRDQATRDHDEIIAAAQLVNTQSGLETLPVYTGNFTEPAGLLHWMAESQPDAVVSNRDLVQTWLRESGFTPPQELGYACISLDPSSKDTSGIRPEFEQIGRRAMELLDHHICTNTRGLPSSPARLVINPIWQDGTTLIHR
jgi:DNA-binding LacI/PurR family transcriptional regulator